MDAEREKKLKELYDKYEFDYVGDFGTDLRVEELALQQAYEFRNELRRKRFIDLQNRLGHLSDYEFEELCAGLFENVGFKVTHTKLSGDRGADLIIEKDFLTYAVQCKCFTTPIGNKAIQEAYSAKGIYNTANAAVITNSTFTKQAIEDAHALGVILWDYESLSILMSETDITEV